MKIDGTIEKYKDTAGALIPVLQEISSTFNYLPEPVLRYTAERFAVPLSEVFGIATFYNTFSLKPKGKNVIKVCLGTSCYVKGGRRILQSIENKLGIKVGRNTEDLTFGLETVNCIGCCGQSPVMSINDEIYGYLKPNMIDGILTKYY